jgi:hypothetical protein
MIKKLGLQNPDTKIEIKLTKDNRIVLVKTENKLHTGHRDRLDANFLTHQFITNRSITKTSTAQRL